MCRTNRSPILVCAMALSTIGTATAQVAVPQPPQQRATREAYDPAVEFLTPYGLQNFSAHYVTALRAFLVAREQYENRDYTGTQATLSALWSQYPIAHPSWGALPTQPFGINIGSPPCYYALRMLTDTTEWRVNNPGQAPAPRTARLTVLVVGRSHGIEPQSIADLSNGTGVPVTHDVDPRVVQDGYYAVHESLHQFREYALAATGGLLAVETQIISLPNVDLAVHAGTIAGGTYFAGLTDLQPAIQALPQHEIDSTDWWWLIYPSHVPEHIPVFQNAEFVTGGMGVGPDSISPMFIIDDRWLVRKPPHIGNGEYSDVERRAYLPQWLQHEFFHHLFRIYPQFGLEATPHQWFNLSTWPPDFVGRYEPDYYHEALYRRLRTATPGLHAALRYSTAGAQWELLSIHDVLGTYRREPVQNPWHIGEIRFAGAQLEWRNTAPFHWNLYPTLLNGLLDTGPDCPYYTLPNGDAFHIVLQRDAIGDLTTQVRGFAFTGEMYLRQ